MRLFGTFVGYSLAGILLAAATFVAPASAGPTQWNLYNVVGQGSPVSTTGCSGYTATSTGKTGCIGDDTSQNLGTGNIYKFTDTTNTKTLYAEAYHTASKSVTGTNAQFKKDFLGEYTGSGYGLGVENKGYPEHAVDNVTGVDFIVFALPTSGFDSFTISLSPFYGANHDPRNMNVTVLWGTGSTALGISTTSQTTGVTQFYNKTVQDLLNGGFQELTTNSTTNPNLMNATSVQTVSYTAPTNTLFTYLVVAAGGLGSYQKSEQDFFKVNALTLQDIPEVCKRKYRKPASCPEPATLAVFGMGMLGVGALYRRRKAVKARG